MMAAALRRERARRTQPVASPATALPCGHARPRPDRVVFGDWQPGPQQPSVRAECRCGCGQAVPGWCWNCGAPVPWQWND